MTPGTSAHQASLSFTVSQSLLRCMSIESVTLSNHLIPCCPLLLLLKGRRTGNPKMCCDLRIILGLPSGSDRKKTPVMQETWVWSQSQKDLLERGMATHSSILACRIPWTEKPAGYSPWGCKELDMIEWLILLLRIILSLLFLRNSRHRSSKNQIKFTFLL